MKRVFFILLSMMLCVSVMAQQKIQLRSADKAECVKSDMTSLKASFSFSTIDAQDYESERGTFSWLSLANTVIGGNEGDPQIPVVNQLIAVPFGAQPRIEITSYSTTDYRLEDYGIHTLVPRQPSLFKNQRPEDVPFVYNAAAYQTRGLRSEPMANVYVDGTMRGIQVGKMTIEPVSYDPVNNTLRVFNDIEVEVHFDDADIEATETELLRTYTPYFDIVYAQLFNGEILRDVYSQHPDLYTTPVKMIVITTSTYSNNTTFQNWVKWKKQKGIYTTVYTTATTGTSASAIKTFIRNQYSSNAPTFVVIVGDSGNIPASQTGSATSKVTDLYYSSTTDSDLYPEMFCCRMPISSTTELTNLLNKILTYEQYTMSDPSYLNETLLIAGWDSYWTSQVGKPTIQYANNYYFNSSHGITPHVYLTTQTNQSGCYTYINQVGFANYTAHGSETSWADPSFSVTNVNSMTNNGKYFWAMGNCCVAANWGYSGTCFAEALLRAANKGAFGYIGSCPNTLWYEDYYFGVGATNTFSTMPTQAQTSTGTYDALFNDSGFNTLNSVPFIGNLAVAYAHAGSYQYSVTDQYYWEAYHCLGDGSVMPYLKVPAANNVSHANTLPIGVTSFNVTADAGSYVAISVNNEIIGVNVVPSSGTVSVPITAQTATGTARIVVTRNQRQPYIQDIQIVTGTKYNITASANPTAGGTVTGAGEYYGDTECTLTATANTGYTFVNWTKNGQQVSTNPTYTFTVTASGNYVANFSLNSYTVTATANPTTGGTITGAGNYNHGTTCTLTATANTGYTFVNWTKDGTQVSTDASINFTVTEDVEYIANFNLNTHEIVVTSVPATGGVVVLSGQSDALFYDFEDGTYQGWTTLQGANGDSPNNWMHNTAYLDDDYSTGNGHNASNGFMLSESFLLNDNIPVHPDNYLVSPQIVLGGSISFWATDADDDYGEEHFAVAVSTIGNTDVNDFTQVQEWTLHAERTGNTRSLSTGTWYEYTADLSNFTGLGYVAIHHFNCYEQWLLCIDDITIVEGYNGICIGTYNYGESCTMDATANPGYIFLNWTENGSVVSENASYTFTVTGDRNIVANFSQLTYTITATANPTEGGTVTGGGTYEQGQSCTLTATAAEGYSFVNWTKDDIEMSTDATYTFTVSETATLVANFEVTTATTTVTFQSGWNWWSANQEITLAQLEEALGSYGISITSQNNGILSYVDGLGWDGHGLSEIDLSKMYKISMSETVDIVLNAPEADPADHPITISTGTNWIGYPVQESMSVGEALSNLTPTPGDVIKSSSSMAMYNGINWLMGNLRTMEPGQGYIYITSATSQTFTYPSQMRGTAALEKNITPDNNHWVPSRSEFRNNMSVVAKVAIAEGMPLNEETEVGAFVGGECRGSAKLIYLEDTDEYMAFLLVYGHDGERVSFKVLNEDRTYDVEETLEMRSDAVVGDFMAPFELHNQSVLSLFPNPVDRGESVRMEVPANIDLEGARVEVYNALGSLVLDETLTNGEREIAGIHTVGIYTVRLTDRKGNVHFGKLIVR